MPYVFAPMEFKLVSIGEYLSILILTGWIALQMKLLPLLFRKKKEAS